MLFLKNWYHFETSFLLFLKYDKMTSIPPQFFPRELPPQARPWDIISLNSSSSFFIPDCQDLDGTLMEEFRRINDLASLFFKHEALFKYCLFPNTSRINLGRLRAIFHDQTYPELDYTGFIALKTLRGRHVLSRDNYHTWVNSENPICPFCQRKIRVLLACPLWELKCIYPDTPIPWTLENKRFLEFWKGEITPPRPVRNEVSQSEVGQFSFIHLVFLIEMAYHDIDPLLEGDFPEGIFPKFLHYDREYTEQILFSMRKDESIWKARAWIQFLKTCEVAKTLRSEIVSFLSQSIIPSDLYRPKRYTNFFLNAFSKSEHYNTLLSLKLSCDEIDPSHLSTPSLEELFEVKKDDETCLSLRYSLLLFILLLIVIYLFSKLLLPLIKDRFFLGGEGD